MHPSHAQRHDIEAVTVGSHPFGFHMLGSGSYSLITIKLDTLKKGYGVLEPWFEAEKTT